MHGLYIHIPFCKKKCNYCDFASFQAQSDALPCNIDALFKSIRMSFDCLHLGEISVELNPESCSEDSLKALRVAGVNRLSIGFQSLHDHNLEILGRIHTSTEALQAFKAARKHHF